MICGDVQECLEQDHHGGQSTGSGEPVAFLLAGVLGVYPAIRDSAYFPKNAESRAVESQAVMDDREWRFQRAGFRQLKTLQ